MRLVSGGSDGGDDPDHLFVGGDFGAFGALAVGLVDDAFDDVVAGGDADEDAEGSDLGVGEEAAGLGVALGVGFDGLGLAAAVGDDGGVLFIKDFDTRLGGDAHPDVIDGTLTGDDVQLQSGGGPNQGAAGVVSIFQGAGKGIEVTVWAIGQSSVVPVRFWSWPS